MRNPDGDAAPLNSTIKSAGNWLYTRHFVVLTGFSVLLSLMPRLQVSSGFAASFAAYGALHALALVLALRMRRSVAQMSIFIVTAAALSAATLRIGIIGIQLSGSLSTNVGLYILGFSAMIGAVSYGVLIRVFGIQELSLREIVVIAVACMFATYAAVFTLKHFQLFGPWWLAVLWWYAFSGGLGYFDHRQNAANRHRKARSTSAQKRGSTP